MRVRPGGIVAAGAATYAAGLGALAVLQHRAFWSGRFDLGNSVQAVWSTAHGDVLSVTALTGVQISRLGAPFEPLLVVFMDAFIIACTPTATYFVRFHRHPLRHLAAWGSTNK